MNHEHFIDIAIEEAKRAMDEGEFPVGAVITDGRTIISKAHNLVYSTKDPTAHAEILAIREASRKLGNWQLGGLTLYATLEPCIMCASAAVIARLESIVYVLREPRFGGVYSLYQIPTDIRLNHTVRVIKLNYREEEIRQMVRRYFDKLRE